MRKRQRDSKSPNKHVFERPVASVKINLENIENNHEKMKKHFEGKKISLIEFDDLNRKLILEESKAKQYELKNTKLHEKCLDLLTQNETQKKENSYFNNTISDIISQYDRLKEEVEKGKKIIEAYKDSFLKIKGDVENVHAYHLELFVAKNKVFSKDHPEIMDNMKKVIQKMNQEIQYIDNMNKLTLKNSNHRIDNSPISESKQPNFSNINANTSPSTMSPVLINPNLIKPKNFEMKNESQSNNKSDKLSESSYISRKEVKEPKLETISEKKNKAQELGLSEEVANLDEKNQIKGTPISQYIKTPMKKDFTLLMDSQDTINTLKKRVHRETRIEHIDQRLFYLGKFLDSENETLDSNGIADKAVIILILKLNDERLYLNTEDNRTFCQMYNPKIEISKLKDQISRRSNIKTDKMILTYNGKRLDENYLLGENKVIGGSSIYLKVESM